MPESHKSSSSIFLRTIGRWHCYHLQFTDVEMGFHKLNNILTVTQQVSSETKFTIQSASY
jgi:hypothetical protein